MTRLNAKKNFELFEKSIEKGEGDAAVSAMIKIFEPLIVRDNDELELIDIFDIIAIMTYSEARASQLNCILEAEVAKMPHKERGELIWILECAKKAANLSLEIEVVKE